MSKPPLKKASGFTLVELIISVSLFMIFSGGLAVLATGSYLNQIEDAKNTQVTALLTETWEAVKAIRNNDWDDIVNGTHGLRKDQGYWEFYETSDVFAGITRSIVISDVQRDNNGNVVEGGGDFDVDSKAIQINLSWSPSEAQNRSLQLNTYLTNYESPGPWPPTP